MSAGLVGSRGAYRISISKEERTRGGEEETRRGAEGEGVVEATRAEEGRGGAGEEKRRRKEG